MGDALSKYVELTIKPKYLEMSGVHIMYTKLELYDSSLQLYNKYRSRLTVLRLLLVSNCTLLGGSCLSEKALSG